MASKKILLLSFVLLAALFVAFPAHAYENENAEDFISKQEGMEEDLSQKTDAELIGMERELKAKLGKDPGNAGLYYQLSTAYATLFDRTRTQKGKQSFDWLIKSRDALEKVLMIRPGDKVAHYNLGVVYKRLGQMERAREELKKAIRLGNSQEDAYLVCASWFQIGLVYSEQGFFDEAKEAFLKARELDYENPDIREAIREMDAKRKAPESGSNAVPFGMSSTGNASFMNPETAAAMGKDPTSQSQAGIEQALPYLGQMLAQKFGGGNSGEDSGG